MSEISGSFFDDFFNFSSDNESSTDEETETQNAEKRTTITGVVPQIGSPQKLNEGSIVSFELNPGSPSIGTETCYIPSASEVDKMSQIFDPGRNVSSSSFVESNCSLNYNAQGADMLSIKYQTINSNLQIIKGNQPNKIIINTNEKKRKTRENYGNGPESEYLKKNFPHYKEPYSNCDVFIRLGKPNKKSMISLGEQYNDKFKKEIKSNLLPEFSRYHKRNYGIAVWFFQDIFNYIFPWLRESGKLVF